MSEMTCPKCGRAMAATNHEESVRCSECEATYTLPKPDPDTVALDALTMSTQAAADAGNGGSEVDRPVMAYAGPRARPVPIPKYWLLRAGAWACYVSGALIILVGLAVACLILLGASVRGRRDIVMFFGWGMSGYTATYTVLGGIVEMAIGAMFKAIADIATNSFHQRNQMAAFLASLRHG